MSKMVLLTVIHCNRHLFSNDGYGIGQNSLLSVTVTPVTLFDTGKSKALLCFYCWMFYHFYSACNYLMSYTHLTKTFFRKRRFFLYFDTVSHIWYPISRDWVRYESPALNTANFRVFWTRSCFLYQRNSKVIFLAPDCYRFGHMSRQNIWWWWRVRMSGGENCILSERKHKNEIFIAFEQRMKIGRMDLIINSRLAFWPFPPLPVRQAHPIIWLSANILGILRLLVQ